MTYNEFINNIIQTRGQWNIPDTGYKEIHHIIPRCCGGLPNKKHYENDLMNKNLIWLYPEEHYIAHKLLALENPDNKKLIAAFWLMSHTVEKKYVSAKDYKLARMLYINTIIGKVQTKESNDKRAEKMLSYKLHWYTNGEIEIRCSEKAIPEGFYAGRSAHIYNILKNKIPTKLEGNKNGMYGKKQSVESNKKRAEWSSKRHWFNNGSIEIFEINCPEGFFPGRLNKNPAKFITGQKLYITETGEKKLMRECLVKRFHPNWKLAEKED